MFIIHDDNTFEIVRGDSANFDIYLPIYDEEGKIIGEYDLQPGDTLLFTVKKNTKTEEIIFQKSGQNITINPSDTEEVSYGKYVYDAELTYATSEGVEPFVDTVIQPTEFRILDEVTFHRRND